MRVFLSLFGLLVILRVAVAQEKDLATFLAEAEDKWGLTFTYDPDLIKDFEVDLNIEDDKDGFIEGLNEQLPFEFTEIDASNYLVRTKPIKLPIVLQDGAGEALVGTYAKYNGNYIEKVTDGKGLFEFNLDWKKDDSLAFESVGFEPFQIAIIDLLRSEEYSLTLTPSTFQLNTFVVETYLGKGISSGRKNHSIQIDNGELGVLPGDVDKDLLVSLRALPGIHTVTGRAGELRIRGSTPEQTLVLFDNIPIYHKGYYFGTISPFSTDAVEQINVYRSGYTPRLGGRIGGAIEIFGAQSTPDSSRYGLATNSFSFSGFGKIKASEKLGISITARKSHDFEWVSPKEEAFEELAFAASEELISAEAPGIRQQPYVFSFWDANGAITYELDDSQRVKFNFVTINSTDATEYLNDNLMARGVKEVELNNEGVNLQWDRETAAGFSNAFITYSSYQYAQSETVRSRMRLVSEEVFDNQIQTTRFGLNHRFIHSNQNELLLGYELDRTNSIRRDQRIRVDQMGPNQMGPQMGPNQMEPTRSGLTVEIPGTNHAIYGSYFVPNWKNFMIDLGVRGNYYTLGELLRIEPRVFLNYFISDRWTLKSSFGNYLQYLNRSLFFDHSDVPIEKLVWQLNGDNDSRVLTSWQALGGFSYQAPKWIVDVEMYKKEAVGMYANGPMIGMNNSSLFGDLHTQGVDLFSRVFVGGFTFWGNYTLSTTEFTFPDLKTDAFPANYDQRHLLAISGTYEKGGWRASLGWSYASGVPNYLDDPFFPFFFPSTVPLDEPTPTGTVERFDAIHQLDASLSYVTSLGKMNLTLGVSVLNLYDRENLLERVNVRLMTTPEDIELRQANRYTIGFTPDLMIKLTW